MDFSKYWHKAKKMTMEGREKYFLTFPKKEREQIRKSYFEGRWKDLFLKNQVDQLCDSIKQLYDIDLLDMRIKIACKKQRFTVPKDIWNDIQEQFSEYENCFDLDNIFGGIYTKTFPHDDRFYELYSK